MQQTTCRHPDGPWWHLGVASSQGATPGTVLGAGCFCFGNSVISQATRPARDLSPPFSCNVNNQPKFSMLAPDILK